MAPPLPFPSAAAHLEARSIEAKLSEPTILPPAAAIGAGAAAAPVIIRVVDPHARLKLGWVITKVVFVIWLVFSLLHSPLQTVKFLTWDLPSFLLGFSR